MIRISPALGPTIARPRVAGLALAPLLLLASCSTAPAQDVVGSYFPSWLLCAALGVVVAAMLRALLGLAGLADAVFAPILTYAAMMLATTLGVWLLWFGH